METEQPNLRNPNAVSRIPIVARAIADVLHENVIAFVGRFNEGTGFDLSPEQQRILADRPVTLSKAMERQRLPELN
jgi:hypothetical protein